MRFKDYSRQGYFHHRFAAAPIRQVPKVSRPAHAIIQKSKTPRPKVLKGRGYSDVNLYEYEADNIVEYEAYFNPFANCCMPASGLSDLYGSEQREEPTTLYDLMNPVSSCRGGNQSPVERQMEFSLHALPTLMFAATIVSLINGIRRLFR